MSSSLAAAFRWHRPLMLLAAAMVVLAVVSVAGLLFDPRELVGAPIWAKPLKFALSILIYSVTWAWLISQLSRFRRVAWWAGTVIAGTLALEVVAMVVQTVRGHRSHFNDANPFDSFVWDSMGKLIMVLWLATLLAAILLWFSPPRDRARAWAVRLGSSLSLVGLGLGFLMTTPTAAQLADYQGIVGAHTVGADDGGPGLLLLGWSTEHGDLRIPHFIGMHALQLIPLALLLIELASRRVVAFRDERTRLGFVVSFAIGYAGIIALVTWQALRGQSIVAPDLATAGAFAAVLAITASGCALSLARGRSRAAAAAQQEITGRSSDRAGV